MPLYARDEAITLDQVAIGQRIATAREKAGLSQTDLARRLGVDQSIVNKIEKGTRAPSVFFVIGVSDACGMSTDDVLVATRSPIDSSSFVIRPLA